MILDDKKNSNCELIYKLIAKIESRFNASR